MISRREFVTGLAACLVALKAGLFHRSDAPAMEPAAGPQLDSPYLERFRKLHLGYAHARGYNLDRFDLNRDMIALAHTMMRQGVPLEKIRAVTHQGLAMAKADFGTVRDPFLSRRQELGS